LGFTLGQNSDNAGILFCSYPALAGEDPNDFFCRYNDSTGVLTEDHDADLCQPTAVFTGPAASATPTLTVVSSPTGTATRTLTSTSSSTVTLTPSATATRTDTATPTATGTRSPTPTATLTATGTRSPTVTATPTATGTRSPTVTASPTVTVTATATVGGVPADLAITKTVVSSGPYTPGGVVTYRLHVSNEGGTIDPTVSVTVMDRLPPGTTFISAVVVGSCTASTPPDVACALQPGIVSANHAATDILLTVRLPARCPGEGTVTNQSEVNPQRAIYETNGTNNRSQASLQMTSCSS